MHHSEPHIYEFGDFRLDAARRLLTGRDGQPVPLTPKPFETLLYLVRHSGSVLDKDELMRAVWPDTVVEENNLSQSISQLRRALGEKPGQHRYIVTVPGRGFRFVAAVRTSAELRKNGELDTTMSAAKTYGIQEAPPPSTEPKRNISLIVVVCLLIVLAVGGFLLWRTRRAVAPVTPSPVAAKVKTIAVLPFKPLVQSEQDQALELGMADTLIAKLSNSQEIVVRPISAVRRYIVLDQDPQMAGRELDVEAVLDGHIQKRENRIRVTARLLNVDDGRQLWAGQFDEKMTDIFAVQDSISERVASALALSLTGEERARLTQRDTEDIEAYQLCLRGRYFLSQRLPGNLKKATEYFQQAIARDPNYALAYASLSDAYNFLSFDELGGMRPRDVMPKAKEAALKALAIDDGLAEAHVSLGRAVAVHERDWQIGEREIKRGLELDPNYSDGRRVYAVYLIRAGRADEALAEVRRAWEIEPGSINKMLVVGWIHYLRHEYDQAIEQYKQVLEVDPNFYPVRFRLGLAYIQKGMLEQAIAELEKAMHQSGRNARHLAFVAYAYGATGRRAEAQHLLNELEIRSQKTYVCSYDLAIIYLGLGDKERALDLLEKADQERDDWILQLKAEPVMDSLRSESRFTELTRKIGPPE